VNRAAGGQGRAVVPGGLGEALKPMRFLLELILALWQRRRRQAHVLKKYTCILFSDFLIVTFYCKCTRALTVENVWDVYICILLLI
jgi:hypothetical protein